MKGQGEDASTNPRQPGEYSSELPQQQVNAIEQQQGKDFSTPDPAVAAHKKAAPPDQPPQQEE
jgi:hypothetical protein